MPDYLKEARKAKRGGDYSKAGDLFYLGGDEKTALDMYLKGNHYSLAARLLEKKEDWKGAAKYYIQAGKYHDAAEIYFGKLKDYRTAAAMFEKNGDLSRASDMAEKAGEIARAGFLAEQADLWERAAHLYTQAHKYERAADLFYRILKRLLTEQEEKSFVESYRNRVTKYGTAAGTLYMRLKKYDRAAQCFEETENLEKAAECYSLAHFPEKAAELYFRMQEYQTAYELLSELGEKCQKKELLADTCFHLKKYEEAAEYYMLSNRTQMAAEAYEEAQDYYRAVLFYESLEDHAKAGELYIKLNEIQKAAESYEKVKNYEYAAKLYEQIGLIDRALECLIAAQKRLYAARLLIARKENEKAISVLQQVSSDQDDYPDACLLLGQLFTEMEMYSVALQKLSEAINKQPLSKDNIEIYYALGKVLEKSAQYTRAQEIYEGILSIQLNYKDAFERLQRIKNLNLLDGVSDLSKYEKRMLASRYELTEAIGRDAFGILYKANDTALGRTVMIRKFAEQDKNITRDILEQTRVISGLSHTNILSLYDGGKDENFYFLCMEYAEGPNLRQYMSRGPIDVSEICEIASQICLALVYAHQRGVVHRNLSPENIYICAGPHVKIANFGIEAKWEKGSTLVAKQYSSPEQFMGHKIDGRSDIYAFGIVLYEMLFATPPFVGKDVELQHLKKVVSFPETPRYQTPTFLLKIVQRCLEKDRQKRYGNAEEILEELEVADIVPGMVLNQRYEIIRELGSGGMGHVYQARDRDLDEIVALKVLRAEISADPAIQKRFLREIKITRMITHPHVVKVFDIGRYKGNRYISMEFIEGTSLDEWLKKNKTDIRSSLTVLAKIIQGIQAAHSQGIIHRDLKPQNVLIDRGLNPHVLDFGIARTKDHVDATSGQVMGSPKYMSPEQIQGKEIDKRSDIYAIGVLMFYMFTGEEPFVGDDPRAIIMKHLTQPPPSMRKINPNVPPWLEKIITKSLEKDRDQRYSSLKEVLEELRKGYETQQVQD